MMDPYIEELNQLRDWKRSQNREWQHYISAYQALMIGNVVLLACCLGFIYGLGLPWTRLIPLTLMCAIPALIAEFRRWMARR